MMHKSACKTSPQRNFVVDLRHGFRIKKRTVPKQRYLRKSGGVFSGQGAYNRAFEFGSFAKSVMAAGPMMHAGKSVSVQDGLGTQTVPSDGTLPVDLANDILSFVHDISAVRKVARVVSMTSQIETVPVRVSYSTAAFYRDLAYAGEGQLKPELTDDWRGGVGITAPTRSFVPVALSAKEIGDFIICTKAFGEDMTAAMGAALADDISRALATRENFASFCGTGAGDGTDGGIVGLLNKLPAGSLFAGPTGSGTAWVVNASNYVVWLNAVQQLPSECEWVVGGREPVWMCSHKFYNKVLLPLKRLMGGSGERRRGEPVMFDDYEVVFNDLYPRVPGAGSIPLTFGHYDHALVFGDRQTVEIGTSEQAALKDGASMYSLWTRNEIALRGIERVDVQFINRGLGTDSVCGVVAGLKLPSEA